VDLSLSPADEAFATELREWLATHLDPAPGFVDLADEVAWGRRWQATLARDRWVGVHWPEPYGGRGATPVQVALYQSEYARSRAPQPVNRVGINLVGPTLLAHGTEDQRHRFLPAILSAEEIWCQLFSEPGAGSDLASLSTRAVRDGDGWRLSGQKVWTSYAQFATWGLCLARTDPDARPQQGITAFAVAMEDPGVDIRPLVQLTGDAEFNEVFLDGVFVPDDRVIGVEGQGWTVAGSTLAHERGTSFPFKEQVVHEGYLARLYAEAHRDGRLDDEVVADALAASYIDLGVLRLHNLRTLTRLGRGEEPGPESSWVKLAWTEMTQHLSEAALQVVGRDPAAGLAGPWARQFLWSRAASIAGGTSEIQRDIIAGRILGLPRG
jgi:alkylation response protein AidB-like acyl-CoA dehydrogenase